MGAVSGVSFGYLTLCEDRGLAGAFDKPPGDVERSVAWE